MKLHLANAPHQQLITGYGPGYVAVNQVRYETNLIVLPQRVVESWEVAGFEALTEAHFEFLLSLEPEIVLLGTGAALRFPHPRLLQPLAAANVGIEVMGTPAACRTYNILLAEGRQVVAALLIV